MSFSKQLAADLHNVFLADSGFAERVTLGGKDVTAQVIRGPSQYPHGQVPGLILSHVRIHVAAADAPTEWEEGLTVEFDGADWVIETRHLCAGLVVFNLSREQEGMRW